MPPGHPGVVVAELVQRERQIPVGCLPGLVQPARGPVGIQHLPEDLHARAVAEKLTGREQIAPERHPVLYGPIVVARLGKPLARHEVEGFPLRQLLVEPRPDLGAVVVLRSWRPVAAYPLLANPPRLRPDLDPLLVDDGVKLLSHLPGLRLFLDHVPSITRPQSENGQVPSPRATVPGDWSVREFTMSNVQVRPSIRGRRRDAASV